MIAKQFIIVAALSFANMSFAQKVDVDNATSPQKSAKTSSGPQADAPIEPMLARKDDSVVVAANDTPSDYVSPHRKTRQEVLMELEKVQQKSTILTGGYLAYHQPFANQN